MYFWLWQNNLNTGICTEPQFIIMNCLMGVWLVWLQLQLHIPVFLLTCYIWMLNQVHIIGQMQNFYSPHRWVTDRWYGRGRDGKPRRYHWPLCLSISCTDYMPHVSRSWPSLFSDRSSAAPKPLRTTGCPPLPGVSASTSGPEAWVNSTVAKGALSFH